MNRIKTGIIIILLSMGTAIGSIYMWDNQAFLPFLIAGVTLFTIGLVYTIIGLRKL